MEEYRIFDLRTSLVANQSCLYFLLNCMFYYCYFSNKPCEAGSIKRSFNGIPVVNRSIYRLESHLAHLMGQWRHPISSLGVSSSLLPSLGLLFFGLKTNEHSRGKPQCSLKVLSPKQLWILFCPRLSREKSLKPISEMFVALL